MTPDDAIDLIRKFTFGPRDVLIVEVPTVDKVALTEAVVRERLDTLPAHQRPAAIFATPPGYDIRRLTRADALRLQRALVDLLDKEE